jgi:acetyl-CoA synthetase
MASSSRPLEILKPPARVPPRMPDLDRARATFSWAEARQALEGLPGLEGGLNIGHECADRHLRAGRGGRVALRWVPEEGPVREVTYADLAARSSRFAHALHDLGVRPGDRVFALARRVPDLYAAVLGILKAGAVFCPLFPAFGPDPIRQRITGGDGVVLVTTPDLHAARVAPLAGRLPSLRHVILLGGAPGEGPDAARGTEAEATPGPPRSPGDVSVPWAIHPVEPLLASADPDWPVAPTRPDDLALLHFTSGTTGAPKGAMHVHEAVVAHHATGGMALDFHPDDVFWCTADPGWVTGTSYGIIAPLAHGLTLVVDEGEFDAERWYRILQEEGVTNWYTAPTAIRLLMKAGPELARSHDLSALRFIASVGEPLNPEAVHWSAEVLGLPIHDNWWQSETGGIMISNVQALPIRPGSMGKPLPGIEAAIVERTGPSEVRILDTPDDEGELALRVGWPSMFRGYLHMEERYRACFAGDWYLTGDIARRDADGYYWFIGRADDLIKSAGHLIGPFEVESALLEHPAVAEAAVIGTPHPVAGEVIKAFVTLRGGQVGDRALVRSLLAHARERLGPAVAPRTLEVVDTLPRTRSGKIMRRLLKARELGLPDGDTSTLEG